MVAIGVSGMQTVCAQGITAPDASKPWSVSATLRGFYDDNRDTLPDGFEPSGYSRESFGFELAPSARLNLAMEQTSLTAGYTYSYKYFDEKGYYETDHDRQSHEFNLALDHAFSERYRINAADSFVIGQEPDQIRTGNSYTTFQTIPGNNIRNEARILFGADLTRSFGIEIGYGNSYVDFEDDNSFDNGVDAASPSLSGLLDRMAQVINLDGRFTLTPSTVAVLGYAFSDTDYLRNEVLGYNSLFEPVHSDARNNRSHYVYVGADHSFTPDFTGSIRAGARLNDYYNDPQSDTEVSPYLRASVRYAYRPDGYLEGGVGYDRTASDLYGGMGADFVRDQEAGTIYLTLRQQIMPKLTGSINAQFQNSTFNGGMYDGDSEQFYVAGVNLEYAFNRHFSAEIGYNYDRLDSDITSREFDRNRIYVGVTATY